MSFSCATGMMRRSTNSRTVSWIASCSSVRSRFKTTPWKLAAKPPDPMRMSRSRASAGEGEPAAGLPLRAVHRLVGGPEQRLGIGAVARADGEPEADRQRLEDLMLARPQRLADPLDDGASLVLAHLRQNERELVAADPVDAVHLAPAFHQHPPERLEGLVAGLMPEPVVQL